MLRFKINTPDLFKLYSSFFRILDQAVLRHEVRARRGEDNDGELKMVDLSDNLELMSDEAANELAEAAPSVQFRITKKPEPEMVYQKNRNMGGAYGTTKQAMAA